MKITNPEIEPDDEISDEKQQCCSEGHEEEEEGQEPQGDCGIQEKLFRMKYRRNKVKYLIYPEYSGKVRWDLSITCLLLI